MVAAAGSASFFLQRLCYWHGKFVGVMRHIIERRGGVKVNFVIHPVTFRVFKYSDGIQIIENGWHHFIGGDAGVPR